MYLLLACSTLLTLIGKTSDVLNTVLYRTRIHPWALCGYISEEILYELYESIAIVIQSSYLSQQLYYPGLVDAQDNHNGLMSKEEVKKNRITLEELQRSVSPSAVSPAANAGSSRSSVWHSVEATSTVFRLKAYAQTVCPLGNAIIKEKGLHDRSVHWVPSVQVRCAPLVDSKGDQGGAQ